MRCRLCGAPTRVLSTRIRSPSLTVRRQQCTQDAEHRFNTLEVPETVAASVGAPFTKAVAMAERGMTQREKQLRVRAIIDIGLDNGDKFVAIAHEAGCSISLVQKRSNERTNAGTRR